MAKAAKFGVPVDPDISSGRYILAAKALTYDKDGLVTGIRLYDPWTSEGNAYDGFVVGLGTDKTTDGLITLYDQNSWSNQTETPSSYGFGQSYTWDKENAVFAQWNNLNESKAFEGSRSTAIKYDSNDRYIAVVDGNVITGICVLYKEGGEVKVDTVNVTLDRADVVTEINGNPVDAGETVKVEKNSEVTITVSDNPHNAALKVLVDGKQKILTGADGGPKTTTFTAKTSTTVSVTTINVPNTIILTGDGAKYVTAVTGTGTVIVAFKLPTGAGCVADATLTAVSDTGIGKTYTDLAPTFSAPNGSFSLASFPAGTVTLNIPKLVASNSYKVDWSKSLNNGVTMSTAVLTIDSKATNNITATGINGGADVKDATHVDLLFKVTGTLTAGTLAGVAGTGEDAGWQVLANQSAPGGTIAGPVTLITAAKASNDITIELKVRDASPNVAVNFELTENAAKYIKLTGTTGKSVAVGATQVTTTALSGVQVDLKDGTNVSKANYSLKIGANTVKTGADITGATNIISTAFDIAAAERGKPITITVDATPVEYSVPVSVVDVVGDSDGTPATAIVFVAETGKNKATDLVGATVGGDAYQVKIGSYVEDLAPSSSKLVLAADKLTLSEADLLTGTLDALVYELVEVGTMTADITGAKVTDGQTPVVAQTKGTYDVTTALTKGAVIEANSKNYVAIGSQYTVTATHVGGDTSGDTTGDTITVAGGTGADVATASLVFKEDVQSTLTAKTSVVTVQRGTLTITITGANA